MSTCRPSTTKMNASDTEKFENVKKINQKWSLYTKIGMAAAALVCVCILLGIIIGLIVPYLKNTPLYVEPEEECKVIDKSYNSNKTSISNQYKKFSVVTGIEYCSQVGANMLRANGSAVDAAIAAGLCNGIANSQSSGIGGGHFMVIYLRDKNISYAIDARESAAISSSNNYIFKNRSEQLGGLSTGIPGEIAGYWEAHKLAGQLPWSFLFEPAIKMCRDGFPVSKSLATTIKIKEHFIRLDPGLSEIFVNSKDNEILKENDTFRMTKLGNTLQVISEQNMEAFYNGSLTEIMVNEINENGGNIKLEDFNNYKALVKRPIQIKLRGDFTMFTQPPPSSGILVGFIMKVMSKFDLQNATNAKMSILHSHRLVEVFKHTFAQQDLLANENTQNILVNKLMNESFFDEIKNKIDDFKTFPTSYYGSSSGEDTPGKSQVSVLNNNDAVSLTSSINSKFGALYAGKKSGIIYNSNLNDFSIEPSNSNYIKPNKRPMSSMSPMIFLNRDDSVRLVLGATGGSRIITAIAEVATDNLWVNPNLTECIDKKRLHNQLVPEITEVESGTDYRNFNEKYIREELRSKGHKVECTGPSSSIQAIVKFGNDLIEAVSDGRSNGVPDGI